LFLYLRARGLSIFLIVFAGATTRRLDGFKSRQNKGCRDNPAPFV
jgi:hypothetical protein